MVSVDPIPRALVAVDSAAADALGAPNYDEFQSDFEVWELLQRRPESVLRISMPHCAVPRVEEIEEDGSPQSLKRASEYMARLRGDPRVQSRAGILWVYEITRPEQPDRTQIGLGGMARTAEIRTTENPRGTIIRNEGIREPKARGRAKLTAATRADLGTVNLAVDDASGEFQATLSAYARATKPDFETTDEAGNHHRVWIVEDRREVERLRALLAREPQAYVADGNHRSAAAVMLGYTHFLTVFFPARSMTIAPYNRLLDVPTRSASPQALSASFEVSEQGSQAFQPLTTHQIGLYDGERWYRLRPRPGVYDPTDAAQDIDADIVQRRLFAQVFGITDAADERITYVGANRDASWLQAEVDAGRAAYAVTLPPVTMDQFVKVCLQNRLMPPKSTWFVPKVRTGLVIALLS